MNGGILSHVLLGIRDDFDKLIYKSTSLKKTSRRWSSSLSWSGYIVIMLKMQLVNLLVFGFRIFFFCFLKSSQPIWLLRIWRCYRLIWMKQLKNCCNCFFSNKKNLLDIVSYSSVSLNVTIPRLYKAIVSFSSKRGKWDVESVEAWK